MKITVLLLIALSLIVLAAFRALELRRISHEYAEALFEEKKGYNKVHHIRNLKMQYAENLIVLVLCVCFDCGVFYIISNWGAEL